MKTNADLDINKIIEERLIDIAKLFHGTKTKISSIDKNGRTIIDYAKTLEHTKLCEILEFLLDEETEIRFKGNTDAINLSNEDSFLLNGR